MKKLNIAELLRDCPSGMELDCTICDNIYFDEVTPYLIKCFVKNDTCNTIYFHHDGSYISHSNAKCVIFPKGKTTWEGFQRPFKDGDIVSTIHGRWLGIVKKNVGSSVYETYITVDNNAFVYTNNMCGFERLATTYEKEKLFKAIKEYGYKWNPETKTLEKLEVNKFDITTLKPFDKVLVRDNCQNYWAANLYSHYMEANEDYHFATVFGHYRQCIPYESNEHLLGTTYDCDEYYKTW